MSSNPKDNSFMEILESIPTAPPPPLDVKKRSTTPIEVEAAAIVKRKKREDMLKKCSLVLRWLCFVFSFIAFVIMVSNQQAPGLNFEDYEEYSYLLAIAIISSVYSAYQGIREVVQFVNGKCTFPQPAFAIIDFIGDQILAYLLISAASAAVPLTNRTRKQNVVSIVMKFIDLGAGSITMAFLAFFTLALSVLISGYQLNAHFFI